MAGKWIQEMHMEKGALRKSLKIKEGHRIPTATLKKAEQSKSPTTRKRANLAETLRKFSAKSKED
jgi:hypothetical protein